MSFPAIQFARHIAQFHIQFYGRTTTTPIYFTVAIPLSPRRSFASSLVSPSLNLFLLPPVFYFILFFSK